MAKNIEINYNSGSGYEVLYPKTIPELTGCLPLTGGTLTGPLMLNGEPSGEMAAVNKGYVDGQMALVIKKVYEGTLGSGANGRIIFWENVASAKILFFAINGVQGTGPGDIGIDFVIRDESNQDIVRIWLGRGSIRREYKASSVILVNNGEGFSPSKPTDQQGSTVNTGAPCANLNSFFTCLAITASVNLVVWAIF